MANWVRPFSTVKSPPRETAPARPVMTAPAPDFENMSSQPPGDRVFITLLSLNFMLLAFFVVLGTTAAVDKPKARSIAEHVRITFSGEPEEEKMRTQRLSARQALQAGVSEALAPLLPVLRRPDVDNSDRVDVAMPSALFFDPRTSADRETLYDGIARLMDSAPFGFRYVLMVESGTPSSVSAAFAMIDALVKRGVAPQSLLAGAADASDDQVRLSFLVFEGDSEDPWAPAMLTAQRGAVSP